MSRSDYDLPKLSGTLGMTKLKNALLRAEPTLQVAVKNVRVNGQLRGCSGFVTNPATGKIAYVDTEKGLGHDRRDLYRTATSTKDYTGGQNQWADRDELVTKVVALVS